MHHGNGCALYFFHGPAHPRPESRCELTTGTSKNKFIYVHTGLTTHSPIHLPLFLLQLPSLFSFHSVSISSHSIPLLQRILRFANPFHFDFCFFISSSSTTTLFLFVTYYPSHPHLHSSYCILHTTALTLFTTLPFTPPPLQFPNTPPSLPPSR